MISPISNLKGKFAGEDVFILGSGSSMDYFPKGFFEGRTLVSVNLMWKFFDLDYLICTHRVHYEPIKAGVKCIVSENDLACDSKTSNVYDVPEEYWMFKEGHYTDFEYNLSRIPHEDQFVIGGSTILCAMQIVAYMGAKTIVMCGCDTGILDGKTNFERYFLETCGRYQFEMTEDAEEHYVKDFNEFFDRVHREKMQVRKALEKFYGVSIVSLSPFLDIRNDDHEIKTVVTRSDIKIVRKQLCDLKNGVAMPLK